MSILRLPGLVQTTQPQSGSGLAQIDRGNSLSDIWLGSSPGRTLLKGVTGTRSGASSSATTVIEGVGPGGRFIRGDGTTTLAGWQINGNSNNLLDNSNTTWFIVRRCRDTTVRSSYLHYGYDSGGGNRAFVGAPDGTNITWDYGNATTGSGRLQTPYTKDTRLETLVLVAGQTKGREIWRRGVKLASDVSAKAARSADAAAFGIGPIGNTTPFDDVETYLFGIDNREWSDAEIIRWCANPWQLFRSPQRVMLVAAAGPDVTVALTGQSATASRGTVAPAMSVGMTGQSAQALRGSVSVSGSADVTVALSGQALTASRGALAPSAAKALIGQAQSAQQGLLTPARAIVVSGQSSTVQRGSVSLSNNVTVALVGQAITAAQGSIAAFAASAAKFNQFTIMRANPLNATATMSDAAINRTANLL